MSGFDMKGLIDAAGNVPGAAKSFNGNYEELKNDAAGGLFGAAVYGGAAIGGFAGPIGVAVGAAVGAVVGGALAVANNMAADAIKPKKR
uniref:Uncharacterized protein n=1 Tax=Panagrolaimus davidi TaxID=227884 RepID=A0A914Q2R3_9BILA